MRELAPLLVLLIAACSTTPSPLDAAPVDAAPPDAAPLDAAADAADATAPGCWDGVEPPRIPASCRTDEALATPSCAATLAALRAPQLATFLDAAERSTGHRPSDDSLLSTQLGFFVDEGGVFISAVHAWEGCLSTTVVREEYLAGRDGPPLRCDERTELLYVGSGARYVTPMPIPADWTCPDPCGPPTSPTSSCFDCQPIAQAGDIVVGRLVEASEHPPVDAVLLLADGVPPPGAPVVALGKPRLDGVVPYDERRVSTGTLVVASGSGVRTTAYLTTGFSGGPMLDACGRVFAVSVSRVNDLRMRDEDWDRTESVGVSLVALRDRIDAALAFARASPPR